MAATSSIVPPGTTAPPPVVDPGATRDSYIGANHWSLPYESNHLVENPSTNLKLLEHVNCNYLSTPGRPPTLLALKQHAQSLAVLISQLAPSGNYAEVDNENAFNGTESFVKGEAFDWLNNLRIHYDNMDPAHRAPLNSLGNLIKENLDLTGVEYHCPLDTVKPELVEEHPEHDYRPFNTHMTLLMHANDCLERLDHEYSAMGGLMAVLPLDNESDYGNGELAKAKTTLLGQWILQTQHLICRMHELEISYANCLDLLANEALVPAQHISMHGPDGRAGREIVFPQDRWILANAGDDVYGFIHQMLDRREALLEEDDRGFRDQGVVGGSIQDSEERTRGIVKVDLTTRFYRLKNSGRGPLFVLPAFGDRPSTQYTKEMEKRPTVVTVPAPSLPERGSAWDRRNRDVEGQNRRYFIDVGTEQQKNLQHERQIQMLTEQVRNQRDCLRAWEGSQAGGAGMTGQVAEAERRRDKAEADSRACMEKSRKLESELALHLTAPLDGHITHLVARLSSTKQLPGPLPSRPVTGILTDNSSSRDSAPLIPSYPARPSPCP
ncbi:hypothetical protein F4778DRAFT_773703 [Xylariomycetidae sp. FL2044]|nr:hypothetical protein F4778DRAFT_773703 [Xylariomycetidae sp. FL2044]